MATDALDTEYENGVADVLGFLALDAAIVERNVFMNGARSGKPRQIDVRVTGRIFGAGNATMVVDCKRYSKPIDVNTVGAFVSLVEDVGAEVGLIVTSTGISDAARRYAGNVRGIQVDILSVRDLNAWSPKGTVNFDYAVPEDSYSVAARLVRRAGFRVKLIDVDAWRNLPGHLGLSAFRHFGVMSPSGEIQIEAREKVERALRRAGIEAPVSTGSGVVAGGGTPAHRWLEVSYGGRGTGLKILAATEQDIRDQLDMISSLHQLPRDLFDATRPEVWPIPLMFPTWG